MTLQFFPGSCEGLVPVCDAKLTLRTVDKGCYLRQTQKNIVTQKGSHKVHRDEKGDGILATSNTMNKKQA